MEQTNEQTQSAGISIRIKATHDGGQHFNDNNQHSEDRIASIIKDNILPHAKARVESMGGAVVYIKQVSLYSVIEDFAENCGEEIDNPIENKHVYMKSDGGMLFAIMNGKSYPLLITEDKVQGTNDLRRAQGLPRQPTGNDIECIAKNIRSAEILFGASSVFPYVVFASGCDLHRSETMSKRLEMMNYGVKNHYIEVSPSATTNIEILNKINISKRFGGKCVASMFVKAHKWDEMAHGASAWTGYEIDAICMRVVDLAIDQLPL